MIEAESLIEALKREEERIENGEDITKFTSLDDRDLGEVLKFCCGEKIKYHALPYSDGTIKVLTEEDWHQ